jgi:phospholipase D1/2
MPIKQVRDTLDQIQGHLVEFPTKFLCFEDLQGDSIPLVGASLQDLYT